MTPQQTRIRNHKILRFRGTAPFLLSNIPEDIWTKLDTKDQTSLLQAEQTITKVIKLLDESATCSHSYDENNICVYCSHKKYSRDNKGKGTYKNG